MNLDAFNGVWVVCAASYTTDPAPDSFSRSIVHTNADVIEGIRPESPQWFVPFFGTKAQAEKCKVEMLKTLTSLNADDFVIKQIFSLKDLSRVLRDFLNIGRLYFRYEDSQPASVEMLLNQIVERL